MNILPLIFAFLFIFSCFAFAFLKEAKSFFLAETVFDSHNRVERTLQNSIAKKTYNKYKGEATLPNREKKSSQQNKKNLLSYRSLFPPLEASKFNLSPLIKCNGEFKLHPLYEPLAELLRILYWKNLFAPEKRDHIEYSIIDALLTKARKDPETISLADLAPDTPEIKKIYYRMLKGTNQYTVGGNGIPPLGDFIGFREGANSAISFSFASKALLEAFFNQEIASQITSTEQKKAAESNKYHYFSKDELQPLLMKNPAQFSSFSALEPYIDYSKQLKPRKEKGGKDEKTGLGIKKMLQQP